MTACLGLRYVTKDGRVLCVASADTEVSGTGNKRYADVTTIDKCVRLGDSYLLMSGMGPIQEATDILLEDPDFTNRIRLNTRKDVRELAVTIYEVVKDLIDLSCEKPESIEGLGNLLFVSPRALWVVFSDLTILRFESQITSGAGEDVATGAAHILLEELKEKEAAGHRVDYEDLENIAYKVISCCIVHLLSVGKPITIHRVDPLPDPPPLKVKKPRKKNAD